jgi:hypothetical protein
MGVGRPQHMAERHAGQHHVVDIAPATPDQPRILETRDRLTYTELVHQPPLNELAPVSLSDILNPVVIARLHEAIR